MSAPRTRSLPTLHLDHLPAVVENGGHQCRTKLQGEKWTIGSRKKGYAVQQLQYQLSPITATVSVTVSQCHVHCTAYKAVQRTVYTILYWLQYCSRLVSNLPRPVPLGKRWIWKVFGSSSLSTGIPGPFGSTRSGLDGYTPQVVWSVAMQVASWGCQRPRNAGG